MTAVPIDIQEKLDEWLAGNPAAQKYVTALYYVPAEAEIPEDVTHVLALASASSEERSLRIGIVAVAQYAVFLDMLLSMLATQPDDDDEL